MASYQNIRTSIRIFHNHDGTSANGELEIKSGITFEPDTDICKCGRSLFFIIVYPFNLKVL